MLQLPDISPFNTPEYQFYKYNEVSEIRSFQDTLYIPNNNGNLILLSTIFVLTKFYKFCWKG